MTAVKATPLAGSFKTPRRQPRDLGPAIVLALFAIVWIIPVVWTLSVSLKPEEVLRRDTGGLLPVPFTIENYETVLSSSRIPRWFFNSVLVSVLHTGLLLAVSAMAAYAFARVPFRGKSVVFAIVLAGLMVPGQVTFIPVYLMIAGLDWDNTYQALILPGIATPFGVFLLTQFFRAIPMEIEEAATIDGASRLTVLVRIILPLSVPALVTLGLFTYLGIWNDFLWPLIAATRPEMQTITVGLPQLVGNWGPVQFLGPTMAASWVAAVPVVIIFLIFQKRLIRGITLGETG
ncbi:MAG: carbohydrate ABC transporter permease [Candidatus Limnocylindria bacterium]